MRNAFADEVTKLASEDPRITFLSGDIGNRLFDAFKEKHSDRFFNCGVAEANMMSVAAGMAMNGLKPIAYTITPFITYRCFEQIRVDVCYHNVPVTIVGVGSGLGYASLGATHQSCEDIACLRSLPHMKVVCPGDPFEVRAAIRAAACEEGPVYIRIGKKGEPKVHERVPEFTIGKAIVLKKGETAALLSTGTLLPEAMEVARHAAEQGIQIEVVSFHTVKPLDEEYLRYAFSQFKVVTTLEEHSIIGGFGSAVSEWVIDHCKENASKLLRCGLPDTFLHEAGEQEYIRERLGLSVESVLSRMIAAITVF